MWEVIVRVILRYRLILLLVVVGLTGLMGWQASKVKLSYELAQMLPSSDQAFQDYERFREIFGEDGNTVFIGIEDERVYSLDGFREWYAFTNALEKIPGVTEVVNLTHLPMLERNDSLRKLEFHSLFDGIPETRQHLDSLIEIAFDQPFYEKLLFNQETGALLTAVGLDADILNTPERMDLIQSIQQAGEIFTEESGIRLYYSGLPFIRTQTMKKVEAELKQFVLLAMLIASIALFFFFRSFKAVLFPMIIVVISVVWALGTISLLGYEITVLKGIIPPLIIIIGVENCIFLLNKYHHEYRSHGNKVKSLVRVVQRVGNATLLTNTTTAVGFATFIITGNRILVEFGIVAALNIFSVFLLTLTLIPIFYSYLDPPRSRHIRHLYSDRMRGLVKTVVHVVGFHRAKVYAIAVVLLVVGLFGMTRLHTSGNVVDDIPHRDPIYKDLLFFERNISGIMPFEIMIETGRPNGVMRPATLEAIDDLQKEMASHPELSRPLSLAEAIKLVRQAFYRGDARMYALPNRHDRAFIQSYLPQDMGSENSLLRSLVDSNMQATRISVQMANIGTRDIRRIQDALQPKIDSLFDPDTHQVTITGTSVVFLKGTDYLVKNLLTSLLFAVAIISVLMALLFSRARMVIISLVPNLFPQVLTAAMMGYLGIPIKPSTIIIFSIALGISVDNSIHFLAKFRQELRLKKFNIKHAVISALRESGVSMIYTYVVLFFGFIIFTFSSFGGTQALGYLIAFTLSVALMSNLFLMPSILLSLHKRIAGDRLEKSPQ
ncbi:MAG: MMPL family transporter [Bacteroidales bacterium]